MFIIQNLRAELVLTSIQFVIPGGPNASILYLLVAKLLPKLLEDERICNQTETASITNKPRTYCKIFNVQLTLYSQSKNDLLHLLVTDETTNVGE